MGGSIAMERRSKIEDLYDFAQWLGQHIRPEMVPTFMRRRIPALQNETPLDWLMANRLDEFRKVYRRAFSYDAMP